MHIFIKVGGRLREERLSKSFKHVFAFSKILSLATLARLRFLLHFMQACNVLHLATPFVFFYFFSVISDFQLPKLTENTHKIAQNCVQNVQKLSAGVGVVAEKGGRRENWGESAIVGG